MLRMEARGGFVVIVAPATRAYLPLVRASSSWTRSPEKSPCGPLPRFWIGRQRHLRSGTLPCTCLGVTLGCWHALSSRRQRRFCVLASAASQHDKSGLVSLQKFGEQTEQSWVQQLSADPETQANAPNRRSRQVRSGHYVRVLPSPLPDPELVIHSPQVARLLGISEEEVKSEAFIAFFSGDQSRVDSLESWCTPYALAIMGQRLVNNCPFGNGNGYGDGRAISVGEVVVDGRRWEMQLKGAGATPFCRGADGRAVLRSSIREFLASEAMHALGIETTRALSLIVSNSETARRPWYSGNADPHGFLSRDPDRLIIEPCAISTRVAPSFLRIGHIDLFARRAARPDSTDVQKREYIEILEHALFREYPEVEVGLPLQERAIAMLEAAADRLSALVAGWLRVGFCQGNFNADNCLIGGRTMDYGPFGFIDKYDPMFAKWTGSGKHYAFMNQPGAAIANYHTLLTSMAPLLGSGAQERLVDVFQRGSDKITAAAADVMRAKMGFAKPDAPAAPSLWKDLEPLMRKSNIDYTIFWRQLAAVVQISEEQSLIAPIRQAFYEEPSAALLEDWASWLKRWRTAVVDEECDSSAASSIASRLRSVNPKYIPREWMLAAAYDQADRGDYALVHELHALFSRPYDEQPDFEAKYYRLPAESALSKGGIAYMS